MDHGRIGQPRWIIAWAALLCGTIASAQSSGGSFAVTQSVIAGGGGKSSAGNFSVEGTAGQAQTATSLGGTFSLSSGFWHGAAPPDRVFRDSFEG